MYGWLLLSRRWSLCSPTRMVLLVPSVIWVILVWQLLHRMPDPPMIFPVPVQQILPVYAFGSVYVPATPTYVVNIWYESHTFVQFAGWKSGSTEEGQRYVLMVTLLT